MCLLIFAHRINPKYPLLVAANRDEFYERPTRSSRFWSEHPDLLAGKDENLGGTWMGATKDGKFAAVTNFRDPQALPSYPRSRGELPLNYLAGQTSPKQYLRKISDEADQYAGFNLLIGDPQGLWYFCNQSTTQGQSLAEARELQPGIYGLSNAHLDTPWPKVALGKQRLEQLLLSSDDIGHDHLQQLVSDPSPAPPAQLDRLGMNSALEQMLSAQFISAQDYGTRSTTTLWSHTSGETSWREISYNSMGQIVETTLEDFARG
ncbi:MAG: hypothetical protein ACI9DH_001452 [Halioglobus sp.]|jgi:uncharacterized protein with NRDE domain